MKCNLKKIWMLFLMTGTALIMATTSVNAAVVSSTESVEALYCTTLYKGTADSTKPLLTNGPLDQLFNLPTTCMGNGVNLTERDGVRALLSLGWRPISVSHQVTPLIGGQDTNGKTDLLVSVIFILQRTIYKSQNTYGVK